MKSTDTLRFDRALFSNGQAGLFLTDSQFLACNFYKFQGDPADIGLVSLPLTENGEKMGIGAVFCGAALGKNAQNPEGAGCLMRHGLGHEDFFETENTIIPDELKKGYKNLFDEYSDNIPLISKSGNIRFAIEGLIIRAEITGK
jgi:hypothetical protein